MEKIKKNKKKDLPNGKKYHKYIFSLKIEHKLWSRIKNGVSPRGKATVFGIVIRWFESSHPSHRMQTVRNGGFFFIYQAFILVRMFKSQNRHF